MRLDVTGIVQGVGFRPFACVAAEHLGLTGRVRNTASGVSIEIQGLQSDVESFIKKLNEQAPEAARISGVSVTDLSVIDDEQDFRIISSDATEIKTVPVSPDLPVCDDCLAELLNPGDRRFRYPFLNCTRCGPRFTIVESVPYDRERTSMNSFPMCAACRGEYEDLGDRRFHAQPTACVDCGPEVCLMTRDGNTEARGDAAVREAAWRLRAGGIVAIKGIGGYHLACAANDERAVAELRRRKARDLKPFAIMVADAQQAFLFCDVDENEQRALESAERPIVLLRKREPPEIPMPEAIAPRRDTHGVMLPYTPLHHLLLRGAGVPLVMTSGNLCDEPIAHDDGDALRRLGGIADCFLTHNRPILQRCDDSVARVWRGRARILRRARGFAPAPWKLPGKAAAPILACGPDLKNTFALARGDSAIVSHHIGDLDTAACCEAFERAVAHYQNVFDIKPRAVAFDMHPDYRSTQFAEKCDPALARVAVQHHHAHIASCMADAGVSGPVIGVVFDGAGYGPDGTVWGGEFLIADYYGFQRAARLAPASMPGSDQAVREPWRMAVSHLDRALGPDFIKRKIDFNAMLNSDTINIITTMMDRSVNSPVTSSMGRLFDAVAALCGFSGAVHYEGQAAIEFETLCKDGQEAEPYPFEIIHGRGAPVFMSPRFEPAPEKSGIIIEPAPMFRAVVADLESGRNIREIAFRFHATVAAMIVNVSVAIREKTGIADVALSGGVFQNFRLLELSVDGLEANGFAVAVHEHFPPNDGGISLGQAAIAAAILNQDV